MSGLVHGNRPEGRLLSCLDSPSSSPVPTVRFRGSGISVQSPPLRSVSVSTSLYEDRGGRPLSPQGERCAGTQLSRRLAYLGSLARSVVCTQGPGAPAPRSIGTTGQPREEHALPCAEHPLSWYGTQLCHHDSATVRSTRPVGVELPGSFHAVGGSPETISEAPGTHGILGGGDTPRVDAHEAASTLAPESSSLGSVAHRQQADGDYASLPTHPNPVVFHGLPSGRGTPRAGYEACRGDNRRLPAGLGCSVQRARSVGALDGPPPALAYQLPRVVGCATCIEEAAASRAGQARAGPVGQHYCSSVYQSSGWRSLTAVNTTCPTPPPVESAGDPLPACHVYPRRPEPDSRRALSSVYASRRVATPPPRSPAHLGAVRAGPGGPVCLPRNHPLPALVLSDRGTPRHGCPSAQLAAGQAEVRLPPSEPHCTDPVQGQGRGASSVTRCATLAQPDLVLGANALDDSSPLADSPDEGPAFPGEGHVMASQARPLEPPCLAPGRDEEILSGLPPAVVATISQARAPATRRLYAYKWRLFSTWCASRGEDPRSCAIGSVLSFLQERLETNLSPSTLKVYVAAIAAHHNSVAGKSLGQHDLVIRFLRGARRRNPPRPHSIPSWDLDVALTGLTRPPFEPLGDASLPHLTMKTVLLLALASIKRVGDLQAFSVSPDCLEFGPRDSHVILRPRPGYVPKVPTAPFRDQVVNLQALPTGEEDPTPSVLCPVRALRLYLDRTQSFRSSDQLFVCFGGQQQGRAVSKQRLAHWIVDAVKAAYQSLNRPCPLGVRAHSTRGVASSWALARGASLADICRAAGWATPNTFARFYNLRVEPVSARVLHGHM
ncbi:uncharacterized protein LOC130548268 [Triplophysa rosa]|uniref:uncharacterized protein LOC130548268 n=1 Tax=Triplophysa rosa TaxID=992332 RepID=UPI002545C485|nr:uncharacterized protein LOC130548268 [Triplophysa rosa]